MHTRIVQLAADALTALAPGDLEAARRTSPVALSPWLAGPECASTWRFRAPQAVETPRDLPWVTGVLWDEDSRRQCALGASPPMNGIRIGSKPALTCHRSSRQTVNSDGRQWPHARVELPRARRLGHQHGLQGLEGDCVEARQRPEPMLPT